MVAQRILAVAEGERGTFDSRLREALVAAHLQYAGMDAVAYKERLVQEVSDMLYDEMIFNKVVQQVEHSYDDDIKAVNERLQPGREISDAQRAELGSREGQHGGREVEHVVSRRERRKR